MEQFLWKNFTAGPRREQIRGITHFSKITTFRKGTKWLRPELVGQRVQLLDQDNNQVFAEATVLAVKATRFTDIDIADHDRQSSDMTPEARL